jgi:hypothetical protein
MLPQIHSSKGSSSQKAEEAIVAQLLSLKISHRSDLFPIFLVVPLSFDAADAKYNKGRL